MGNVIENIMELKNMSELMVDLAYSAVFLQSKHISNEVMKMEREADEITTETLKHIFKIRGSEEQRIRMIEFIDYITDITNAAKHIAELVGKGSIPEYAKNILSEADKRIMTFEIKNDSVLAEKTLEESLVRSRTGANIISINRGEDWLFGINKNTVLKAGDTIVAVGSKGSEELLEKFASGRLKTI